MPELLVTATIEATSGIPADAISNSFAVDTPTADMPTSAELQDLLECFGEFYTDVRSTSESISAYLSPSLSRTSGDVSLRVYDVSANLGGLSIAEGGVPSGPPVASRLWGLSAPISGAKPLPAEVALVITLRGVNWATVPVEEADDEDPGLARNRPRQRKSGRLFIGPLNDACLPSSGTVSRPDAQVITTLLEAAQETCQAVEALGADYSVCVWSRADEFFHRVTDVQVDNAWDTQRRRGEEATSRSTAAV